MQAALTQVGDKVEAAADGRAKTDVVVEDAKQAVQDGGDKVQAAADSAAHKAAPPPPGRTLPSP